VDNVKLLTNVSFELLKGSLIESVFGPESLDLLSDVLNLGIVQFELGHNVLFDVVVGLYREIFHLKDHLLKCVYIVQGNFWGFLSHGSRLQHGDLCGLIGLVTLGLDYVIGDGLHLLRELGFGLRYLGGDVFLNTLCMLEDLLHGVGSRCPVLLEHLSDLIYTGCQIFYVGPLTEGLGSPDQILHIIILCEIRIFQVLMIT
jgi:hypothetical protein